MKVALMHKEIFSEITSKLRTKLIILSGISLFIGITEKMPHDFTIIGLKLGEDDKTLGWFILVATAVIFSYFLMRSLLEIKAYNANEIILNKTRNTTSEFSGMTKKEYYSERENSNEDTYSPNYEMDSIDRQNGVIEKKFIISHNKFKKLTIYIFELVLPVVLAATGVYYLFSFLIAQNS